MFPIGKRSWEDLGHGARSMSLGRSGKATGCWNKCVWIRMFGPRVGKVEENGWIEEEVKGMAIVFGQGSCVSFSSSFDEIFM